MHRCDSMLKAFEFVEFQPGEDIIVEGQRGLTFFIIITGSTQVLSNMYEYYMIKL
jgi:hypothetical protein